MTRCFTLASSPVQLMQQARAITGIDLVDQDAVEPLDILWKSFNEDSCLHEEGAKECERKLLRILCNRLRMQRDIANHPEILEQDIIAPVIICGMPRTGSTKTQKMLAASGDFNWIPFWQSRNPSSITGIPNESVEPRVAETDEYIRWFHESSPEVTRGHEFGTFEPDEESWILEHSLRTNVFQGYSALWGYLDWLSQPHERGVQFQHLKDTLKYLQWQGLQQESRRWVLKCPLYVGLEKELLNVFPDACLIMTHRSPLQTAPSICKLSDALYTPQTAKLTDYGIAINGFAALMQKHLDFRKENPDVRFMDIDYEELISKEDKVLDATYAFCGMPRSQAARDNSSDWNARNPRHKAGSFKYSIDEFGFTSESISELFADYNQFLSGLRAAGAYGKSA